MTMAKNRENHRYGHLTLAKPKKYNVIENLACALMQTFQMRIMCVDGFVVSLRVVHKMGTIFSDPYVKIISFSLVRISMMTKSEMPQKSALFLNSLQYIFFRLK